MKMDWLPDMDLNHDKQIQSLLCYRYTIGQTSAFKLEYSPAESRLERRLRRETTGAAGPELPRTSSGESALINTPLQRGDREPRAARNCFSGFPQRFPSGRNLKTAKAVGTPPVCPNTPLKRGVNDKSTW